MKKKQTHNEDTMPRKKTFSITQGLPAGRRGTAWTGSVKTLPQSQIQDPGGTHREGRQGRAGPAQPNKSGSAGPTGVCSGGVGRDNYAACCMRRGEPWTCAWDLAGLQWVLEARSQPAGVCVCVCVRARARECKCEKSVEAFISLMYEMDQ